MLPDKYEVNHSLQEMHSGEYREIKVPSTKTHSIPEMTEFAESFAESIVHRIRNFDIYNPNASDDGPISFYEHSIRPISKLFREVSIPV